MSTKGKRTISRRLFLAQSSAATVTGILTSKGFATNNPSTKIVRAAIHPAIGIARVGDSENEFFIGPEVTDAPPKTNPRQWRDSQHRLKRQAARFRVFGYNEYGEVVRELTAAEAQITWQVHVANKKANWYRFLVALDLTESQSISAPLRNPNEVGEQRRRLEIDPGAKQISGVSQSGEKYHLTGGTFMGQPVSLGELRTDKKGRLLFLGGHGKAGSPKLTSVFHEDNMDTFNNANGWYDDLSDGPVHAKVVLGGQEIPVEGAWVVVAPPNYAPDVVGWRTLYDLLSNTFMSHSFQSSNPGRNGSIMKIPAQTSFTKDVYPILLRLTNLQWVNKGFEQRYGRGRDFDFSNKKLLQKLNDKSETESRRKIYDLFRFANTESHDKLLWPMLYGDAYGTFDDSPKANFVVTGVTELHLKRWAEGDYIDDWGIAKRSIYKEIDEVPIDEQPAMLDKAALHYCLADAFHPGCELTWPVRHVSMYRPLFGREELHQRDERKRPLPRIKEISPMELAVQLAPALTAATVHAVGGPLYGQGPGTLTRWMAIPWQGDTIFCRSGYEPEFDPYLPSYWPARVPNQVLSEEDYQIVMDTTRSIEERRAAFRRRQHWSRSISGSISDQINQMIQQYGSLGVVEARPGIQNSEEFPSIMLVESCPPEAQNRGPRMGSPRNGGQGKSVNPVDSSDPAVIAGFQSKEDLEAIKKFRKRSR